MSSQKFELSAPMVKFLAELRDDEEAHFVVRSECIVCTMIGHSWDGPEVKRQSSVSTCILISDILTDVHIAMHLMGTLERLRALLEAYRNGKGPNERRTEQG
jgi:hypothetical protein